MLVIWKLNQKQIIIGFPEKKEKNASLDIDFRSNNNIVITYIIEKVMKQYIQPRKS